MTVATHGESWNGHVNIELMKMFLFDIVIFFISADYYV